MRAFPVRLPSGQRHWTVLDEDLAVVGEDTWDSVAENVMIALKAELITPIGNEYRFYGGHRIWHAPENINTIGHRTGEIFFVFVMAAMAYVTEPWHVFALRAVQGLFAGYGALTLTMAADCAPRDQTAYAIGFVQTAQRLGPALGPVIGGVVAQAVGLRDAFFVTASFYAVAVVVVTLAYDESSVFKRQEGRETAGRVLRTAGVGGFPVFAVMPGSIGTDGPDGGGDHLGVEAARVARFLDA